MKVKVKRSKPYDFAPNGIFESLSIKVDDVSEWTLLTHGVINIFEGHYQYWSTYKDGKSSLNTEAMIEVSKSLLANVFESMLEEIKVMEALCGDMDMVSLGPM